MKSKTSMVVAAPDVPTEEAQAKRLVEDTLQTLETLKQEMLADQRESDRLGKQIDARLARLRERLDI